MGAFLVVQLTEAIEGLLLSGDCSLGWGGRFFLDGSVQSFMPAVLFRTSRGDPFREDTQFNPPD